MKRISRMALLAMSLMSSIGYGSYSSEFDGHAIKCYVEVVRSNTKTKVLALELSKDRTNWSTVRRNYGRNSGGTFNIVNEFSQLTGENRIYYGVKKDAATNLSVALTLNFTNSGDFLSLPGRTDRQSALQSCEVSD